MSFEHTKMVESRFLLHPEDRAENSRVLNRLLDRAEGYSKTADVDALLADWREEMTAVQSAYVFSGRREILRWLTNRIRRPGWLEEHFEKRKAPVTKIAIKAKLYVDDETVVYKQSSKQSYRFEMDMDVKTARKCAELIRDMCECGDLPLLKDALRANSNTPLLTKQKAFQLGHMLGFSVNEMENYLRRCFADGVDLDGVGVSGAFDVKSSSDLIEYFTFLFPEFDPDALRKEWNARKPAAAEHLGEPIGSEGITMEIYRDLRKEKPDPDWEEDGLSPEERKERFISWLEKNAEYLDRPSRSGTELMRCLSRKAIQVLRFYDLIPQGREFVPAFPRKQMDAIAKMIGELDGQSINLVDLPNQIERDIATRAFAGWDDWEPVADVLWYFFGKVENNRLFAFEGRDWDAIADMIWNYFRDRKNDRSLAAEESPCGEGATKTEQREKLVTAAVCDDHRVRIHRQADSPSLYSFPIPRTGDHPGLWIQDVAARVGPTFRGVTGKNRLANILSGELPPQKNDVLFLILFISTVCWLIEDMGKADLADKETLGELLKCELSEFQSFAHGVLDPERYPSLGRYYLPHYTEYMMNTAIVFSVLSEHYHNPMSFYLRLITSL